MGGSSPEAGQRVALLFTRYPVATETFLQREVLTLCSLGDAPLLLALWPAPDRKLSVPFPPDHVFGPLQLSGLIWAIPYWLCRNPKAMCRIAAMVLRLKRITLLNVAENLLGFAYAITRARSLTGSCTHLHAVWASAPAAAAWALHALTGISYSMSGHAYDLYEDGGDGLLEEKVCEAAFIRTSTEEGKRRWLQFGARRDQVEVIRRGLPEMPGLSPKPPPVAPYRILSVGRFVEKMGYAFLLEVLTLLQASSFPFRATLVGDGPLHAKMVETAEHSGLSGWLRFTGQLPYATVEALYREADLFLFTGEVAASGDRAGFPNAIGEAMAWGVPVCARPVGAVPEGIRHGQTGFLFDSPAQAAEQVRALLEDGQRHAAIRTAARSWAGTHFNSHANMECLRRLFARAHRQSPGAGS